MNFPKYACNVLNEYITGMLQIEGKYTGLQKGMSIVSIIMFDSLEKILNI